MNMKYLSIVFHICWNWNIYYHAFSLHNRLIYCLLGACDVTDDHSDVASRLDDYLWLKLSQIRDTPSDMRGTTDFITYAGFQDMILEKYGN